MSGAARIHPSAIVDPGAELDGTVSVGPYAIIERDVRIGAGTSIGAHCVIGAGTTIGRDNVFHPFGAIGGPPQDKKYGGEPTTLVIGDGNTFREYVTVNRGTVQDRGRTDVGDDNWIMAYVHIAHDCIVGSHVILANTTNLAGHVELGDWAILGGFTGVHQFCKIGAHAMTGVGTVVLHDLPPYVMASGTPANAHGLNSEGLRRRGFDAQRIQALRRAYRSLYRRGLGLEEARAELAAQRESAIGDSAADLALLSGFLGRVTRGIVR
ncbi:MAG: acyl-ACP--UDP-N-acetylglucosamine O-acyltransferase [Burkholderiaceae bacterium]|jgi:UDP-N-acetylglucosamine acyltransferase|nr:acyl-ACP--UDP-N-acetylglucosamine O-acyltransferase [Burkholderiaceae bacterium]MEB2320287.1 acyl-ACP--UDP-N-acetylglucosamine O-acyltransferase [Pseudomonadota bacterium]